MVESFEAPEKSAEVLIIESLENEVAALRGALRMIVAYTEKGHEGSCEAMMGWIRGVARDAIYLGRQGEK